MSGCSTSAPAAVPRSSWIQLGSCESCTCDFGLLRRRHHCRRCGKCVCASCSSRKLEVHGAGAQRACDTCYSADYDGYAGRLEAVRIAEDVYAAQALLGAETPARSDPPPVAAVGRSAPLNAPQAAAPAESPPQVSIKINSMDGSNVVSTVGQDATIKDVKDDILKTLQLPPSAVVIQLHVAGGEEQLSDRQSVRSVFPDTEPAVGLVLFMFQTEVKPCSVAEAGSQLHAATKASDEPAMVSLIDAWPGCVHWRNNWGCTALHFACMADKREAAALLLVARGADLDEYNEGIPGHPNHSGMKTPLEIASATLRDKLLLAAAGAGGAAEAGAEAAAEAAEVQSGGGGGGEAATFVATNAATLLHQFGHPQCAVCESGRHIEKTSGDGFSHFATGPLGAGVQHIEIGGNLDICSAWRWRPRARTSPRTASLCTTRTCGG